MRWDALEGLRAVEGDGLEAERRELPGILTFEAAARALMAHSSLNASQITRTALEIAGDLCIYTNKNIEVHEL